MSIKLTNRKIFASIILLSVLATLMFVQVFGQDANESSVSATIYIKPNMLNLKSKGRWITVKIQLPEGYLLENINITTLMLNDTIPMAWVRIDQNRNVMVAKFRRSDIVSLVRSTDILNGVKAGNATLVLSGRLTNGTSFEGSNTIRVIQLGRCAEHDKHWESENDEHKEHGEFETDEYEED